MKHAVLGASSSKRWIHCPGSVRLSSGIASTTSSDAQEGTAAHELAEICLTKGVPASDYLGDVIQVDGAAYEVTEKMAEGVQLYLDVISEIIDEAEMLTDPVTKGVEVKFHLDWLYPNLYGTNDCNILAHGMALYVLDYKNGFLPVNAVEEDGLPNSQLGYYALGALGPDNEHGVQEVIMVVVQPNTTGQKVKRHSMTPEALYAWGKEVLIPAAKATEEDDAALCAGEWCRFCPAKVGCPELRASVNEAAAIVFSDAVPDDLTGVEVPSAAILSPEELGRALQLAEILEPWIKDVRARVLEDLTRGVDVAGWKRVNTRATNSWSDEKVAAAACFRALRGEAYNDPKLKSPAQIRATIKKLEPEARKKASEMIEPLIKSVRGITVAPESDPREAIPAAPDVFTAVEDDDFDL